MKFKLPFTILLLLCINVTVSAQKYLNTEQADISKEYNGATFNSKKSIAENLSQSKEFSIESLILKDENLIKAFEDEEMVTIFVFNDASFAALPKKSRDSLLANKKVLNMMVKHMAIPGRLDRYSIENAVKKNGSVYYTTLSGEKLGVKNINGKLFLFDAENNTAEIIKTDFFHKNGFFHIVEGLVYPEVKK